MTVNKKEMQLGTPNNYYLYSDDLSSDSLLLGDEKKLVKLIPDNSINLICTNLPYVYKAQKQLVRKLKAENHSYSNCTISLYNKMIYDYDLHRFVKNILRVQPKGKVNAYIWCTKKQGEQLRKLFAKHNTKLSTIIIWHKPNHLPFNDGNEYCYYFKQHIKPINLHPKHHVYLYPNSFEINHLGFKVSKSISHAPIKPLFINSNFIYNSSKPSDCVLDIDASAGTIGVACKMLNRNFIGIEHIPQLFNLACKRLSQPRSSAKKLISYEVKRQKRVRK